MNKPNQRRLATRVAVFNKAHAIGALSDHTAAVWLTDRLVAGLERSLKLAGCA